eukprot:scaffold5322_cov59-Phaeocystis_antarctica.AAC.2
MARIIVLQTWCGWKGGKDMTTVTYRTLSLSTVHRLRRPSRISAFSCAPRVGCCMTSMRMITASSALNSQA